MEMLFTVLSNALVAIVPAIGFALIFNVPRRALLYVAMGAALARGLRDFFYIAEHLPIEWATLLAASTLSMVGVLWARRLRAHPKVFTVAAIISMIPGVPAFTMLLAIVQINQEGYSAGLWEVAVNNGLKAFFLILALAFGLAMPGLLFYRRRPVV